jgi:hypothetical protein
MVVLAHGGVCGGDDDDHESCFIDAQFTGELSIPACSKLIMLDITVSCVASSLPQSV